MNNSGYVCLMIILKMPEVRFDGRHIEGRFKESTDTDVGILKTAKELGLRGKLTKFKGKVISRLTVPGILKKKDGAYFLVLRKQGDSWLILDPARKNPEKISNEDLRDKIKGDCIIIGKKSAGNELSSDKRFGFRWFLPTIFKYKKQFISILLAAFVSLCRAVLFVHTTSRIDVILSARLFRHLFSLPLKYFENRRTVETVA
ncbi:MAG: hypothetical protein K6C99_01655 [Lachnospiraceae bacterium]|nr:hypothetical protein [Lachnospiraceae bacterium]